MNYVNYTPHDVKDVKGDPVLVYPMSGSTIRNSARRVLVGTEGGVDLYTTIFGEPETVVGGVSTPGLPPQQEGVKMIVSGWVREKCPDRHDLVSPAEPVRDGTGTVIGCRSFDTN